MLLLTRYARSTAINFGEKKKLSLCYGEEHYVECNSSSASRYCVYFTIAMVKGLFNSASRLFACSLELLKKQRVPFWQNLEEFQTSRKNSLLSSMITDQLNFYNVDKHKSSSCCFYVYNNMATL